MVGNPDLFGARICQFCDLVQSEIVCLYCNRMNKLHFNEVLFFVCGVTLCKACVRERQ